MHSCYDGIILYGFTEDSYEDIIDEDWLEEYGALYGALWGRRWVKGCAGGGGRHTTGRLDQNRG